MKSLLILPAGAKVKIGGDIEATVLAATIRGLAVRYEVAYWDGRCRREDWVSALEIEPADEGQPKVRVGFAT